MAQGLLGLGLLPEKAKLKSGLLDFLGMSREPDSDMVTQLSSYIDNNLPASKYPSARSALLGTISKEAGEGMKYNTWQGGHTDKKLATGPGYGLFQTEMPHYFYKKDGRKFTRNNPTEKERERFVNYAGNTLGGRYNRFIQDNRVADSAEAQINFMSNIIKKDKELLKAFSSNDYKKAIELFTAKVIRPRAYINKKTRADEIARRVRAAEKFK